MWQLRMTQAYMRFQAFSFTLIPPSGTGRVGNHNHYSYRIVLIRPNTIDQKVMPVLGCSSCAVFGVSIPASPLCSFDLLSLPIT